MSKYNIVQNLNEGNAIGFAQNVVVTDSGVVFSGRGDIKRQKVEIHNATDEVPPKEREVMELHIHDPNFDWAKLKDHQISNVVVHGNVVGNVTTSNLTVGKDVTGDVNASNVKAKTIHGNVKASLVTHSS